MSNQITATEVLAREREWCAAQKWEAVDQMMSAMIENCMEIIRRAEQRRKQLKAMGLA